MYVQDINNYDDIISDHMLRIPWKTIWINVVLSRKLNIIIEK